MELIRNAQAWKFFGIKFQSFRCCSLTKPYDMEDEAKRNMKSLKEMKVDKKNNAYIGI